MPNLIAQLLKGLEESVTWVDTYFRDLAVPLVNERAQIAAACFDIAIESQKGLLLLCRENSWALFFASQRVIFEALLKGMWIQICSEKGFVAYKQGNGPNLRQMTELVSEVHGNDVIQVERFRERLVADLHDFTHTGYRHIIRRHSDEVIGPNYSDRDIRTAINFAVLIGLQAAARMAVMANRADLATATHRMMAANAFRYSHLKSLFPTLFKVDLEK